MRIHLSHRWRKQQVTTGLCELRRVSIQSPRIAIEIFVQTKLQRIDEHTGDHTLRRSEEHTSEVQSLMRISYAVFCLKKKNRITTQQINTHRHNMKNR